MAQTTLNLDKIIRDKTSIQYKEDLEVALRICTDENGIEWIKKQLEDLK